MIYLTRCNLWIIWLSVICELFDDVVFKDVWFKDGYIKMWYCYLCTICVNYAAYVDAMFKMLMFIIWYC
jgi:hypothetical protein